MAVKVGELYGTLELDKKPFDAGLASAESGSKGWASRISGTLGGAAKALGAFAVIGGVAAVGGLALAANAASDLNEQISKTEVVFGANSASVLAWSKNSATAFGMSREAALSTASTLGNMFVSMDIGTPMAEEMSTSMVELAGDLGSFNNMDPTEVLEKLRAGLTGEMEPLKSLGVALSAADVEAQAMKMGLGGLNRELTAAEKAQATYALILDKTATAQGNYADTAGGMANLQRTLGSTFTNVMAEIGQAVVPLIEAWLPSIIAGLTGFGAWVTANMPTIKGVLETVFTAIGTAIGFVVGTVIPALVSVFQTAAPTVTSSIGEIGAIFSTVVAFIADEIIPRLMIAFAMIVDFWSANGPTIMSIVGQVFGAISAAIAFIWPIVESVGKVLFPLLMAAAGALFTEIDRIFKAIGVVVNVASQVIAAIVAMISGQWTQLQGVTRTLGAAIGVIWAGIQAVTSTVWNAISGIVRTVVGVISATVSTVFNAVKGTVTTIWNGISSTIGTVVRGISTTIGGVFRAVAATLAGIWNGIRSAASTAWNGIVSIIKGVINGIIGAINGFIGAINAIQIHIPSVGVGPVQTPSFDWNGVNLGYIPRLAQGTRNFGGGFAMVGERGPELAYLPRGSRVWPTGTGPGGGDGAITIQGPLMHVANLHAADRREVDNLVLELQRRVRLRTGRELRLGASGS